MKVQEGLLLESWHTSSILLWSVLSVCLYGLSSPSQLLLFISFPGSLHSTYRLMAKHTSFGISSAPIFSTSSVSWCGSAAPISPMSSYGRGKRLNYFVKSQHRFVAGLLQLKFQDKAVCFFFYVSRHFFFTKPTQASEKKKNVQRKKKHTGSVFQTTWPTNHTSSSLCWAQ